MLKIGSGELKVGTKVILPEAWHEKVMDFGKMKTCPYEYEVEEIVKHKATRETYCFCKPEKKDKGNRIAISEIAIRYLYGQEVPDQNIGLSFREFLPLEASKFLK